MPDAPHFTPKAASEWRRLIGFCLTGGGGFLVHAGVLYLLLRVSALGDIAAWFPAFIAAVLFTWLLNRFIAFKGLKAAQSKRAEASLYFLVQSAGAAINFCVYGLLITAGFAGLSHPIIALALASLAALGFNYGALRLIVYRG